MEEDNDGVCKMVTQKFKPKDTEYKHDCGCVTAKYKDGVKFVKMCRRHKLNNTYIWIVIQHPHEE